MKDFVIYANGVLEYSTPGSDHARWTPSAAFGIKAPARPEAAIVLDVVMTRAAPDALELGYQLAAPDGFNIGPGFSLTLEKHPHVTFGLAVQREFGATRAAGRGGRRR